MPTAAPQRTQTYDSTTSVSAMWEGFEPRADDVFVCTPPKSGTTWMQSICGMLIFRDADVNPGNGTITRWLDSSFNDADELFACLQAQTHRRYIKTHTPLDGIIYDPRCTYVAVYRHPLDVVFSGQNHMKNMKSGGLDHLILDDVNAGVSDWIDRPFSCKADIGDSLESLVAHFKSLHDWRHLPNIHLFHYQDMKRDLVGAATRLSAILGYDYDARFIAAVAQAATFSNMKKNAEKFAPSADRGIWKDNAQFFESGTSNKWDGVLSDETLAQYDARMAELLPDEERAWFEGGAAGGA